jgi:copper(I)-binding protein
MTMRKFILISALALSVPALVSPAWAKDSRVAGVEVRRPWTRPAAAGMNGVGYFTLANVGSKPVRLIAVESPAARSITLHQTTQAGGVSSMRPVTGGVVVAPGGKVEFSPGGYHLMLMGLAKAQAVGGKVPLTLVFEGGRRMTIALSVEAGPPKTGAADPMAGMHH